MNIQVVYGVGEAYIFYFPKVVCSWNDTTNYLDPFLLGLTALAATNLIKLIDGALPIHPMAATKLFIIHQNLWEIWLNIFNRMVFQK